MIKVKIVFFWVLILWLLASCRYYKLEKELEPEYAEFLTNVQYIITSQEKKAFLNLPEVDKPLFIEDFWKKRDPDPYTEVNEFKEEYFDRIEKANMLFTGEGKPGWLSDRGRIYVLFGPPTDRFTSPMSMDRAGRCREVWYYGGFPVIFYDSTCSGTYVLVTINLEHLHDINMAQAEAMKAYPEREPSLDLNIHLEKKFLDSSRFEGTIIIEIPYEDIWFSSEKGKFMTLYDLTLEIKDKENTLLWEKKSSHEITLNEEELREKRRDLYRIEIPLVIDKDLERLRLGKNRIYAFLKNQTGEQERKKVFEFSLEE